MTAISLISKGPLLLRDAAWLGLVGGVLGLLVAASAFGWVLGRRITSGAGRATVSNINARIRAWWVIALIFVFAVSLGTVVSVLLFSLVSLLALHEFGRLVRFPETDRRVLLWSFLLVTPLQYLWIWMGWYGLFSIFIPIYASILLAIRFVFTGDTERFLERSATHQWGLVICVYFVSHGPALLMLPVPGFDGQNAKLLFFLVVVVQLSDVLQYVWGTRLGRRPLAPSISPNKTWEGLIGGVVCATLLGASLWWATPFSVGEAAMMAFVVAMMGVGGGLIMSAIKRDRGVKDYGSLLEGHGGILDRIDSLCFAAPVFFHLTRFFHTS